MEYTLSSIMLTCQPSFGPSTGKFIRNLKCEISELYPCGPPPLPCMARHNVTIPVSLRDVCVGAVVCGVDEVDVVDADL